MKKLLLIVWSVFFMAVLNVSAFAEEGKEGKMDNSMMPMQSGNEEMMNGMGQSAEATRAVAQINGTKEGSRVNGTVALEKRVKVF